MNDHHPVAVAGAKNYYEETTPGAGPPASLTRPPAGRSRGRSTSGGSRHGEFMNESGAYYDQHAGAGGAHQMYTDDDASQKSESSRRKLALGRALLGELRNIASSLDQLNGGEGGEGKDSDEERARTGRISTLSDFLNAHSRSRDILQPQHASPYDEASDFDGESVDAHSMGAEYEGRQRQRRDKHQKEVQRRESKRNRLENYRHNPSSSRRLVDHGDEADDDASCKTWSPNRPEGAAPQVASGGSRRVGRRMSNHRNESDRRRSVGDDTVRRRLLSKNVVSSLLELAKDDEQAAAAALLGVAGRGFYSSHGAIPTDDEDSIADTGAAAAAAAASGRSRPLRKSKLASKLKKKATRGIGSRGDILDEGMGSSFGSGGGAEAAAAIVAAATEGSGRGGASKAEALLSTLKALAASLDDDSILEGDDREGGRERSGGDVPAHTNASRRRSYELALAALDVEGDQDDESTTVATTASASSSRRRNKQNGEGAHAESSGRRSRKSRTKVDENDPNQREKLVNEIVSDTYFKVRRSSTSGIDAITGSGGNDGGGGGGEAGDGEVVPFTSNPDAQIIAQNFAAEHRIFLKAALDLLGSRDKRSSHTAADRVAKAVGTATAAPGAASVALKVGTLKKASHLMRGVWKAKYVEVRRGFFIYYEEEKGDGSDGDEVSKMRKAIPLETSRCTCRPVKIRNNPLGQASGFIFELTVAGGPKRLWMANTKEERYSWICAVYEAMVSASDFPSEASQRSTRGPGGGDMQEPMSIPGMPSDCPHRDDLEQYLDVQDRLKHAETKISYIGGLHELWRIPLRIPVQWIRVQMEASASANATDAFQEGTLCSGIEQLWKDMMRDSVSINGNVIKGDSGHGPERIIGALSKCIMDFDKSSALRRTSCSGSSSSKTNRNLYRISEAQAISYARDILLACNRTRSAGDSYYCVDMLCSNQTLVVLCPKSSEAEPLQIVVRHATEDDRGSLSPKNGHSNKEGWIPIRSIGRRTWCNHYCILSEGVFSYYEKGYPKPHKLKGQLLLEDVKIQTSSEEVRGNGNPAENPLRKLKDRVGPQEGGPAGGMASPVHMAETSGVRRIVDVVSKDGTKGVQLCFQNDGEFQKWRGALQRSVDYYQGETGLTKPGSSSSLKVDDDSKDGKPKKGLRAGLRSTVQVALEASTLYKICTTNPQGHNDEDTWATLQTKFVQSFRLSGGSNGRIMRGEEIVQMLILEGLAEDRDFERVLETTQSKIGLLEGLTERGFHR